ncbi:hypothetical protein APHAL10511_002167 [Amanita phalloides]|nr:hypothetical protein APHAL10511_002167 [Amanita phalloides]
MADATLSFVTLGLFIIDDFLFMDDDGNMTGRRVAPQESGQLLLVVTFAECSFTDRRRWNIRSDWCSLSADKLGMVVDKGHDFPTNIYSALIGYGEEMWLFRNREDGITTRALNSYRGEHREFQYLTTRIRLTPRDLHLTRLARPKILHFICSPTRASIIMSEVSDTKDWNPVTIYEPIPYRCIPSELLALLDVLPHISVLSPNAEEALSLLSLPLPPSRQTIEAAADEFVKYNIGGGSGWVIIRSGVMGAYVKSQRSSGVWIDAFWTPNDSSRVQDVTGAGNSFLGGLAAGLILTGNIVEATLYASVSASFVIEQEGLPALSSDGLWNNDSPQQRLKLLQDRMNPLGHQRRICPISPLNTGPMHQLPPVKPHIVIKWSGAEC